MLNSGDWRLGNNLPAGTKRTCSFDSFKLRTDVPGLSEAVAFFQRSVHMTEADIEDDAFTDIRLVTLTGTPGLGKTHLALAYGWAQIEVLYFKVADLLQELTYLQLTDEWGDFKGLWDRVKEVDTLILDDLGVERPTDSALARLDALIDARYQQEGDARITVITTNLPIAKLPPRIASRLGDRRFSKVFTLAGPDYRLIPGRVQLKETR